MNNSRPLSDIQRLVHWACLKSKTGQSIICNCSHLPMDCASHQPICRCSHAVFITAFVLYVFSVKTSAWQLRAATTWQNSAYTCRTSFFCWSLTETFHSHQRRLFHRVRCLKQKISCYTLDACVILAARRPFFGHHGRNATIISRRHFIRFRREDWGGN